MQGLNTIDVFLLLIIGSAAMVGFGRGLIRELLNIATWVFSLTVASLFSKPFAALITHSSAARMAMNSATSSGVPSATQSVSSIAVGISYALIFIVCMIIGNILGYLLNIIFSGMGLGLGNRMLGVLFGCVKGMAIVLLVIVLAELTPVAKQAAWKNSMVVKVYQPMIAKIKPMVTPGASQLKNKLGGSLNSVSSGFDSIGVSPDALKTLSKEFPVEPNS